MAEQKSERPVLAPKAEPAPAAAKSSHLVRMAKTYPESGQVEFIDVHPKMVQEHLDVGFLVVKK